ncbi:MAG: CinA family protein [Gammaproteobacteria bacterium]|nr:CinA family protein [Gammaproteobacteria bacterium]
MDMLTLSQRVGERLLQRGWMLATAESCTGGGIAAALTDIDGSSRWFERGFITYSNEAKQDMLSVRADTLKTTGAVSEAIVSEMAQGALAHSWANIAVAVSGIAGPTGGTPDKPVGTVCLAWAIKNAPPHVCTEHFSGDRATVRAQTIERALHGILDALD